MVTGDWGWVSSSIPRFKNPLGGMVHGWHQIVHQMALFYPQHPQPSWDFQKPSSRNRGTGFVPPGASSRPLARRCLRRNARKAQLRWTGDGEKSTWKARKNRNFSGNNMKSFEDPWKSRKSVGNIWEMGKSSFQMWLEIGYLHMSSTYWGQFNVISANTKKRSRVHLGAWHIPPQKIKQNWLDDGTIY